VSKSFRDDFPVLSLAHPNLVYLDSAATTQKPSVVIKALESFYSASYATIHRGVYGLSQEATDKAESVRKEVQRFIHASRPEEIIFVRGATEAINLVASSWGRHVLQPGDEIIVTVMEHHSNLVPWQVLRDTLGVVLHYVPILDNGALDMAAYQNLLSSKTKWVAVTHVSNVLGTINPIADIVTLAHGVGAKVLVDGAQAVAHMPVDVRALDVDFYCFSGHKMYGPTGIGVLYGKYEWLETMAPYQTGGSMIESVALEKTTFAKPPARFEAGTPAIAEIIGLGAAIGYLRDVGFESIQTQEHALLLATVAGLTQLGGVQLIGTAPHKAGVVSFVMEGVHPHDIGTILDHDGIAIRAGHHCAQPLMVRFGVPATARISFGIYNTLDDVQKALVALAKVREIFQ
jgi:cysteine desulfurase/selenocysteine lyase